MKKIIVIFLLICPISYTSADVLSLIGIYSPEKSQDLIEPHARVLIESFAGYLSSGDVNKIAPYFPSDYAQGRQRKLMKVLVEKYQYHGRYASANAITLEMCSVLTGNEYPNCLYRVDLQFEHGRFLEKLIIGRPKAEIKIVSVLTIQPRQSQKGNGEIGGSTTD